MSLFYYICIHTAAITYFLYVPLFYFIPLRFRALYFCTILSTISSGNSMTSRFFLLKTVLVVAFCCYYCYLLLLLLLSKLKLSLLLLLLLFDQIVYQIEFMNKMFG